MKKRYRSLFGSSRGRVYREPKRSSKTLKFRRSQSVRLRSRTAAAVMKEAGRKLLVLLQFVAAAGLIIWGGVSLRRFWHESPTIRIQNVVFDGDIPSGLRSFLDFKQGQNVVTLDLNDKEKDALVHFPELKDVSIRRTVGRDIVVRGHFRRAIAVLEDSGRLMGIDEDNVVFPMSETRQPAAALPVIKCVREEDRARLLEAVKIWKDKVPEFSSVVKNLEIDRMREFHVAQTDDVLIDWGLFDVTSLVERAGNVMRLRKLFEPARRPAALRFVADDRIVMDANWIKIQER